MLAEPVYLEVKEPHIYQGKHQCFWFLKKHIFDRFRGDSSDFLPLSTGNNFSAGLYGNLRQAHSLGRGFPNLRKSEIRNTGKHESWYLVSRQRAAIVNCTCTGVPCQSCSQHSSEKLLQSTSSVKLQLAYMPGSTSRYHKPTKHTHYTKMTWFPLSTSRFMGTHTSLRHMFFQFS